MACMGKKEFECKKCDLKHYMYPYLFRLTMSSSPCYTLINIGLFNIIKQDFYRIFSGYKKKFCKVFIGSMCTYCSTLYLLAIMYFKMFTEQVHILFLSDTDCFSLPDFGNATPIGQKKTLYRSGEKVTYKCPNNYLLDGPNTIQCINSQWIGKPICRGTSMKF